MKFKRYILILLMAFSGCIEEVAVEPDAPSLSIPVENILVVDARLSDELKNHEVQLSRIFGLDDKDPTFETGAQVNVLDDQGANFAFEEISSGTYRSAMVFAAEQGRSYQLFITTADGKNYSSTEVLLPENTPIGEIRAERIVNDEGLDGVSIFLDNSSSSSNPSFFRYEFEETYKIIAPRWEPFRFEVVLNTPCIDEAFVVDIVQWEDERRTCFGTSKSQRLIQSTSAELGGGINDNFQLHFISRDNYIISHRYSINVTQYAQTADAYSFYDRLGDFSSGPDFFSQVQPGFLEGNITLESNPDEMALGYFEVTSVSKKRIYFNYEDVFPGEPLPPYPINCETLGNPRLFPEGYTCFAIGDCEGQCVSPLIDQINSERIVYAGIKEGDTLAPYFTWPSLCGDCTQLGSNVVPEFWIEE